MAETILMSIKPVYAERILADLKDFEFRKRLPADLMFERVILYASSPVQRVVGEFRALSVFGGTPEEIWARCKDAHPGIDYDSYTKYFANSETAWAICVNYPERYETPRKLLCRPPQSWCYLKEGMIEHA